MSHVVVQPRHKHGHGLSLWLLNDKTHFMHFKLHAGHSIVGKCGAGQPGPLPPLSPHSEGRWAPGSPRVPAPCD